MKSTSFILALFAALIFSSCNDLFFYKPAETLPENIVLAHKDGFPNLTGSNGLCQITAEVLTRGNSEFLDLNLHLLNLTDSAITFRPEEVLAYGFDENGRRARLRVYTAQEFIRHRNTREALLVGLMVAVAVTAVAVAADKSDGLSGNNCDSDEDEDEEVQEDEDWFDDSLVAPPPAVVAPNPAVFAPTDGLLREHTLLAHEALAGQIKVRKNPNFNKKLLVEVPIDGRYVKFVYDGKERRW